MIANKRWPHFTDKLLGLQLEWRFGQMAFGQKSPCANFDGLITQANSS